MASSLPVLLKSVRAINGCQNNGLAKLLFKTRDWNQTKNKQFFLLLCIIYIYMKEDSENFAPCLIPFIS